MKLEDLQTIDNARSTPRYWASDGGEGEDMYFSAVDYPTVEAALAAYRDVVGDDWYGMTEDDYPVDRRTIPCCDHEASECDRALDRTCRKAVMQDCWVFEV